MLARDTCEKHILWKLNSGECSFWWDNWTEKGPLVQICPDYTTRNNAKAEVKDFMIDNRWNMKKLYNTLPSQVALYISSIEVGNQNKRDYAMWRVTEDGKYSNVSAWKLIRNHRQVDKIIKNMWHKSIPFKHSFLGWRLFYGKLPFNEARERFSNNEDVDCMCCVVPQKETIQHVFVEGTAADHIWKAMGGPLGIRHQHIPVRGIFDDWWSRQTNNKVHTFILQATL